MSLEVRTKQFALTIIKLFEVLRETNAGQIIGKQVIRSGTSVGAQYREARRARSPAEFVAKIDGAIQELDETAYWLELISEACLAPQFDLKPLQCEANELTAMLVASSKTVKAKKQ
jgi:four helix bundle protein